ncbi:MAG TPA: xanthine dehydrogenase family protein molybdopterin-binding subunit [Acidobacteriaceae bacterium]|jgi:xanthine dehydrogenase YagR molybdenum-binding subunit|nr:xanthine dehydrogenase family protein molybdopterin-binding subunit [Acidobacteriaceae bacterium]
MQDANVKPNAGQAQFSPVIGAAVPRVDGPRKTTGTAMYATDYNLPGLVYAVPVTSTIAHGKIRSLDASRAEAMPGVLLVLHQGNIGPLFRIAPRSSVISEERPPFEDDVISYWGQYVALVVAKTFEQAQAGAAAVRVTYDEEKPNVATKLDDANVKSKVESKRGDTDKGFAGAPVQVDETYGTPAETHNPMEMHGTVARWDGKRFLLYECTQGVVNHLETMAQVLGVPRENVEVISRFIGSGFGGKLFPWPHSALAAAASRKLGRPVKLTLSRKMMFYDVGHRPRTQQQIRLGATPDGRLVSLEQRYRNITSLLDDYRENCGEATPFLYSTPNLTVSSALVRRTLGTPAPMRGPGAVPGLYALESAMDELAIKLKMDPVELRLKNDTLTDESNGKPFSSRHLKECLQVGAERFGWQKRTPKVGSMRQGGAVLGWGVAAASWGAWRGSCQATVILRDDGTARVSSAAQDIGTGTYTVMAQVASDKTGLPIDKIEVVLGDSSLVPGATSGGSTLTATVMPAVAAAANEAVRSVLTIAARSKGSAFYQRRPEELAMTNGRVHVKEQTPESGVEFAEILRQAKVGYASGVGRSGGLGSDTKARDYSTHSFGAQFAEVEWQPEIARLRVNRMVTVIDGGRIINLKTGTNQIAGAVVMGVGMALLEHTIYDPRNGHPVNDNYADYLVATSADAPQIDVHFLEIPDPMMGEYGARGIGEIGLAGVAPAITAAVYHATGVRVRELPVRIEDLLVSSVV